MEAGRGLLSLPPTPQTTLRSVPVISRNRNANALPFPLPRAHLRPVAHRFPASLLLQDLRHDFRPKVTLDRHKLDDVASVSDDKNHQFWEYLTFFQRRLFYQPGYWYLVSHPYLEKQPLPSIRTNHLLAQSDQNAQSVQNPMSRDTSSTVTPFHALSLAKEAMRAAQAAASLLENPYFLQTDHEESQINSLVPEQSPVFEKPTVSSGRNLERQSKKRGLPKKQNTVVHEISNFISTGVNRKSNKGLDSNDPLRLFLGDPVTKQLLTVKEERDLFIQIQDLMRVEEVKSRLLVQFDREPTHAEWAEATGMSCRDLQSCIASGNHSREKMIYANFRLVVHVAKQYQGKGLDLQDLLQVGSMGLMKSLEKFKSKIGCRFPTYAYWWIRQSIKKAIFQNSRTIRLPENVFALLKKVKNERRCYIQEKGHNPNNEDLAKRVGIAVERLERILISSRTPVSIQECAWTDQDVTFQEITADPEVEAPDLFIAKQMMRQHARNLLGILSPRERQIIRFRYGIDESRRKTLSDIGDVYGVSRERVRQLERRALDKLKVCLNSQGLEAYVGLLV